MIQNQKISLCSNIIRFVRLHKIMMNSKLLKIALCTTLLLNTFYTSPALAGEGGGEGGGNAQTPVQVIVQIVVTAVVLKVLAYFDLP
ncbi:hypothetical protein ACE1CI_16065 [Aerosakkonemataceae cyanobacterium BLCC-F50]|uniref:Uncharacterized protein n=1 Tax=Floridaenema flaviceps BLCC-F50 TaxID=3153642 RepID=A0ABV4XSA3_9CYAN